METRMLPITQDAIGRRQGLRSLCRDQAHHHIGSVSVVVVRRENHCGSSLGHLRAGKCADDYISGLQRSSRS